MRLSPAALLVTLLPSFIAADQAPLKDKVAGIVESLKQYIPSGTPPNPIDAGASAIAALKVEKINIRNFERKLSPKLDEEEEWMVYLTGGNKSCFGRCGDADLAWNESVPLLAALPKYPNSILKLGYLNCEVEEVLCTGFAPIVPSVYHFILPQKLGSSAPLSPMRDIRLNATTVAVSDIVAIPRASQGTYKETPEYTGILHPIDGFLAKNKLFIPASYVLWGFGSTPSWLIMIGISFFSRQYMSMRGARRADQRAAAAPGAPAARAGAAPKRK